MNLITIDRLHIHITTRNVLPIISSILVAISLVLLVLGLQWLPLTLGAIYLILLHIALETTGW